MKVAILAGGRGIRLHGDAADQPKALFNIGDRPIIWHIMEMYQAAGFADFVILLGYKAQDIVDFFVHQAPYLDSDVQVTRKSVSEPVEATVVNPAGKPWSVTLCWTGLDSATGERVRRARPYLESDERFILTYGDGLANVPLGELLEFHSGHGKLATVTVVKTHSQFGHLIVDDSGLVEQIKEKPLLPEWINGGFFIFDCGVFDYLERGDVLERDLLPRLATAGELMAYRHEGFWACMDTYKDSLVLNELWATGQRPWLRGAGGTTNKRGADGG